MELTTVNSRSFRYLDNVSVFPFSMTRLNLNLSCGRRSALEAIQSLTDGAWQSEVSSEHDCFADV
jgi:hypothetical protein